MRIEAQRAFFRWIGSLGLTALWSVLGVLGNPARADALWREGFEGPSAEEDWVADRGVWETGAPTSGPMAAFEGLKVAATVLTGNAPEGVDSIFYRYPSFTVPPAELEPRLTFRHWFDFGADDYGYVVVQVVGSDTWETHDRYSTHSSGVWTRASIDLSKYAGKRIRAGFMFHTQLSKDNNGRWQVNTPGPGWYLDEVAVVTGATIPLNPDGFEDPDAADRWQVSDGVWQIGEPTSGPGKAWSGTKVAGTVLAGNYTERVKYDWGWGWPPEILESWLLSPVIVVPSAELEPQLSYHQWYDFGADDYGQVKVWVEGATEWEHIWSCARHSSGVWSRTAVGLSKYAGKRIQVGFLFHAQVSKDNNNQWKVSTPGPGWYVDDVEITTGPAAFLNPEGFEDPGAADRWSVSNGVWEIGEPTSGPGRAWSGTKVAGTVLGGNYTERVKYDWGWGWPPEILESRLVSPIIEVPGAAFEPRLRSRHWYEFGADDYGRVQVKAEDAPEWDTVATYNATSGTYSYPLVPLDKYAGKRVRLGFLFHAQVSRDHNGQWRVNTPGAGWYLDHIAVLVDDLQLICGTSLQVPETHPLSCRVASTLRNPVFGLAPGAPEGVSIDPVLGLLTWVPSECQAPSTNQITITVTDPANPTLQPLDYETITVIVEEVNEAPVIGQIVPIPIEANVPVVFNAADFVYDPDCPAQTLTFSLDPCSPANATVDPETGRLDWTPTDDQAAQAHTICLRVTDEAGASTTAIIQAGAFPVISQFRLEGNDLVFAVERAITNETIVVESALELKDPPALTVWTEARSFTWQSNLVRLEGLLTGDRAREFFRLRFAR